VKKAVVDSVLKSAIGKLAEEIAALLGEEFKLSEPNMAALSKEEFFETRREKCALTRLKTSGDAEGEAAVVLPLKDAILLGGTLIMLPDDELAKKVKNPDLAGEEGDAFGEIANILAGSITSTFEEMFPKKLHFAKSACENLVPTKVDMDSDQPFAPGHYHVTASGMTLAGKKLGNIEIVLPFALLGMEPPQGEQTKAEPESGDKAPEKKTTASTSEESSAEERQAAARVTSEALSEDPGADEEKSDAAAKEQNEPEEVAKEEKEEKEETAEKLQPSAKKPEAEKKKGVPRKVVDNVLDSVFKEIAKDLSDLIGKTLKCAGPSYQPLSKEDYLALPRDKGAISFLEASGDAKGNAFLIVRQKDAILFGGTLVMLPEEELRAKVKACDFDGEEGDAYGEVANIIAGSLAKVIGEQYPRKLHFKRTKVEPFIPTKIDPGGNEPFAPGEYYLGTCQMALDGKALGELDLLFPLGILDVHIEEEKPADAAESQTKGSAGKSVAGEGEKKARPASTSSSSISADDLAALQAAATTDEDGDSKSATVLVLADSAEAAAPFNDVLADHGLAHQTLSFQDNIKQSVQGKNVAGTFLVMEEVGEQGMATAIKIKSALKTGTPLIMAGPAWTRSAVLQAVRYGACDILVTPASADEISEKVTRHLSAETAAAAAQ
jgi:chemotaxis protein CheY-P-specific phosphatase CheC/ActR/RegA family two-component response regulator